MCFSFLAYKCQHTSDIYCIFAAVPVWADLNSHKLIVRSGHVWCVLTLYKQTLGRLFSSCTDTDTHTCLNTHAALMCPAVRHSSAVVSSRQIERRAAGMNRLYCAPVKVAAVVSQGDLSSHGAPPQGASQGTSEGASVRWHDAFY